MDLFCLPSGDVSHGKHTNNDRRFIFILYPNVILISDKDQENVKSTIWDAYYQSAEDFPVAVYIYF